MGRNTEKDEEEVAGYTPTREEVRVLASYWAERRFDLKAFIFEHGQVCRGDFMDIAFAEGRLEAMAEAAGEDLVNEATEVVREVLCERWGGHFWDCFERGDWEALGNPTPKRANRRPRRRDEHPRREAPGSRGRGRRGPARRLPRPPARTGAGLRGRGQ
jgi:hypothetical protein